VADGQSSYLRSTDFFVKAEGEDNRSSRNKFALDEKFDRRPAIMINQVHGNRYRNEQDPNQPTFVIRATPTPYTFASDIRAH
jgi:hypothetical protein